MYKTYVDSMRRSYIATSKKKTTARPTVSKLKINDRKLIHDPLPSPTSLEYLEDLDIPEADEDDILKPVTPATSLKKLDLHIQYYEIARVVQILLHGNLSATITQLTLLHDMELEKSPIQDALLAHRGYDVLINLLEVWDPRCHVGSLRVIKKLASNNKTRMMLTNLGAVTPMISLLKKQAVDVRIHVASALKELCHIHKAARMVRKEKGIPLLLDNMNLPESILYTRSELLSAHQKQDLLLATSSADALKNIAKFPKGAGVLHKCCFIPIVKKILLGRHVQLLTCTFQLLDHCASLDDVRLSIEVEGMLAALLKGVTDGNEAMRAACSSTIAQCAAKSSLTCHIVRMLKGLRKIVNLTRDDFQEIPTLNGLTAAVAKLGQDTRNIQQMSKNGLVNNLICLLKEDKWGPEVITNVMEGLAECARLEENRTIIADKGVIPLVIKKLMRNDPRVLTAAAQCLGTCARDPKVAQLITDRDGMRLLFSVLQDSTPSVPATALWALRPIVEHTKDSAEEIRNLVGALGLLIHMLDVQDDEVLAQACGFVGEVVRDHENLQILSERGLVRALAECAHVKDETVCTNLAEAIAYCSYLPWNAHEFGLLGVVPVMKNYLTTENLSLHLVAMKALAALTKNPLNCVVLHECGGLEPVLNDMIAPYNELQDYAMVVVNNMRRVALAAEKKTIAKRDLVNITGGAGRPLNIDEFRLLKKSSKQKQTNVRIKAPHLKKKTT